jgi:hypothetical protein
MATKQELAQRLIELLSFKEMHDLVGRLERERPPVKIDWARVQRTCPKCEHEGPVDPDFGIVIVRGKERPQSWCRDCRNKTNYHNQPRIHRSR